MSGHHSVIKKGYPLDYMVSKVEVIVLYQILVPSASNFSACISQKVAALAR